MIDIQLYCPKKEADAKNYIEKFKALIYSFFDYEKHEWITKPTLETEITNVEGHVMFHAQFIEKIKKED